MRIFAVSQAGGWLLAALLTAPLAAAAQTVPPASAAATLPGTSGAAAKATHVAAAYHAAAPEQRADRMSQEIARQLNLNAATTAKVRAAALVRAQKIDAIQTGTTSNKEKNTALQANAQEFKTTLQGILTPEQFAQYTVKMGKKATGKMAAGATQPASE